MERLTFEVSEGNVSRLGEPGTLKKGLTENQVQFWNNCRGLSELWEGYEISL